MDDGNELVIEVNKCLALRRTEVSLPINGLQINELKLTCIILLFSFLVKRSSIAVYTLVQVHKQKLSKFLLSSSLAQELPESTSSRESREQASA